MTDNLRKAVDMAMRELGSDTSRSAWSNNALEILSEAYRAALSSEGAGEDVAVWLRRRCFTYTCGQMHVGECALCDAAAAYAREHPATPAGADYDEYARTVTNPLLAHLNECTKLKRDPMCPCQAPRKQWRVEHCEGCGYIGPQSYRCPGIRRES